MCKNLHFHFGFKVAELNTNFFFCQFIKTSKMSSITNILNNCYVNSSIQIISILLELREVLVKHSAEHSNSKYHFLVRGFPTIFLLP